MTGRPFESSSRAAKCPEFFPVARLEAEIRNRFDNSHHLTPSNPKYGNMTQEEAEASITLFANEVIPEFRDS